MPSAARMPLPSRLHLELTNRCNSECHTCVRTAAPGKGHDMPIAEVAKIIEALPLLQTVALQVNGEPLLYPHLEEVLHLLARRGVRVELNSNGLALDEARGRVLLQGLAQLNISLDAATPETYRRMRGVDAMARVLANVERFLRMRGPAPNSPRVSLWMTGTALNLMELPGVVEIAARIGAQEVYLQRFVYFGAGAARAENSLHGRLTAAHRTALQEANVLARRFGIALRASGGYTPLAMLDVNVEDRRQCDRARGSAVVMANGDVVPCCICTFTGAREDIRMGSLKNATWADIWNGVSYSRFRSTLWQGKGANCCAGCGERWSL